MITKRDLLNQHIQGEPDLEKVEKAFIVNVNRKQYAESLKRRKNISRIDNMDNRIQQLEEQIDQLMSIIESHNQRLLLLE